MDTVPCWPLVAMTTTCQPPCFYKSFVLLLVCVHLFWHFSFFFVSLAEERPRGNRAEGERGCDIKQRSTTGLQPETMQLHATHNNNNQTTCVRMFFKIMHFFQNPDGLTCTEMAERGSEGSKITTWFLLKAPVKV